MVLSPAGVYAGAELAAVIGAGGVDSAVLTPTVLSSLDPAAVAGLGLVITAGEACAPELVRSWAPGRGAQRSRSVLRPVMP